MQDALISADFGVVATDEIIEELKDRVYRKKVTDTDGAKKLLKQIMIESVDYEIPPYEYPLVILVAGVNGVGKTTAIGKLANKFKKQGKSVVVAAADTFRAAASEQLEIWAERADVRIIKHGEGSDPASVVYDAVASAKAKNRRRFGGYGRQIAQQKEPYGRAQENPPRGGERISGSGFQKLYRA